jgi:hypothetical protein
MGNIDCNPTLLNHDRYSSADYTTITWTINTTGRVSRPIPMDSQSKTGCTGASYRLDYLVNDADISFLSDLEFEDGTPIYNQRELEHMHDVKVLVQQMLAAWWIVGIGW